MRRRTARAEDIKGILSKVVKKLEKAGPGKREEILRAWQDITGERAAAHSRPVSIRRKVLTIEVDSSVWLYGLNLKKKSILKSIKKQLEQYNIDDIRFKMGDIT